MRQNMTGFAVIMFLFLKQRQNLIDWNFKFYRSEFLKQTSVTIEPKAGVACHEQFRLSTKISKNELIQTTCAKNSNLPFYSISINLTLYNFYS